MVMVLFFNPEDEVSIGAHEKTGPGNEYEPIHTAFGMVGLVASFLISSHFLNQSQND